MLGPDLRACDEGCEYIGECVLSVPNLVTGIAPRYYQWLKLDKTRKYGDKVSFVVPSGNFGNALAGAEHIPTMLCMWLHETHAWTRDSD